LALCIDRYLIVGFQFARWLLFVSLLNISCRKHLKVPCFWKYIHLVTRLICSPLNISGQIKNLIDVQNNQRTRKAFFRTCVVKHDYEFLPQSSVVHYHNHHLFSTQKCLALALALVNFNIFRIFVMIMLLNTTSLLIATKLLVYLFVWKSINSLLHLNIFLNGVCVQFSNQVKYLMWKIKCLTEGSQWHPQTIEIPILCIK